MMNCVPGLNMIKKYQLKECYVKLTSLGDYDDVKWTIENTTSIYRNQQDFLNAETRRNKLKVCQICYKTFALASDLKVHMHFVHSNHPTLDETLHYSFIQKLSKSTHSTGEINAPRKVKKRSRKWKKPKKRGPRPRNHKCDMCGIAFDRPHVLRQHYEAVHLKLRPCRCRLCGERFSNKYSLLSHVTVSHVATKRFECPLCVRNRDGEGSEGSRPPTFSYRSTLLYHLKTVHYDNLMLMAGLKDKAMINNDAAPIVEVNPKIRVDTRGYECSTCGAVFKHQVHYRRHWRRKHGPPTSRFVCHFCPASSVDHPSSDHKTEAVQNGEVEDEPLVENADLTTRPTFSTAELLERHIKLVHLNLKPFSCLTCGQRYCDRVSLELHAKRAHNPLVATRPCPFPGCDKSFTSIVHLSRHFRTFHGSNIPATTAPKPAPLECDTPSTKEIKILAATSIPKFKCAMCNRRYHREVTLSRHVAVNHEGRRNFSCHLCGAAFPERAKLYRHFASQKHSDIFITPCHYCDRRFEGPTQLSRHLEEVNNHVPKVKSDSEWKSFKYSCRLCNPPPQRTEKQNGGHQVLSGDDRPAETEMKKMPGEKDGKDKESPTRFRLFIELELHHQTVHPGQPMPVAPKKIVNPNPRRKSRKRKRDKIQIKIEPESLTEKADDNLGTTSKEVSEATKTTIAVGPEVGIEPEVQIVANEKVKKKYARKKIPPGTVVLCEECGKTMKLPSSLKRHKIIVHGYPKQQSFPKSRPQKSNESKAVLSSESPIL